MVVPMLVAMPCSTRVAVVFYVTIPHRCAVCGLGCLLQCDAVVGVGDTSRTRTTRHRQEREQAHVQARNVSTPVQMPTPHRPQTAHHSHRATIGDPPTRALHMHWVALLACVGGLTFIVRACPWWFLAQLPACLCIRNHRVSLQHTWPRLRVFSTE